VSGAALLFNDHGNKQPKKKPKKPEAALPFSPEAAFPFNSEAPLPLNPAAPFAYIAMEGRACNAVMACNVM
jgi:hypothetical protein